MTSESPSEKLDLKEYRPRTSSLVEDSWDYNNEHNPSEGPVTTNLTAPKFLPYLSCTGD